MDDHQDQPGKAVTAALVGADSPKEVLLIVFPHPKILHLHAPDEVAIATKACANKFFCSAEQEEKPLL